MGRIVTALLGLMLTLSACSGDAEPSPPSSSAPPTTSTPTTTPSPTAPVMPEAAKVLTRAGAVSFVSHFWDVVNYATNTGMTDAIRDLAISGCEGCEGGIAAIDKIYDGGGSIAGGATTLSKFHVDWLSAGELQMARVTVTTSFAEETIDMPGAESDSTRQPNTARYRIELVAETDHWKVAQLAVLR